MNDPKYRQQIAAERLLENSSLRDALTDDQAQRLLDWGLAHVERTAVRTARLPDDDAEPLLDDVTTAVSQVMKQVNRLVDEANPMDEAEALDRWQRLMDNLNRLQGQSVTEKQVEQGAVIAAVRNNLAGGALFNQLIAIVTGQDEEE